jgi:hypothetical protein
MSSLKCGFLYNLLLLTYIYNSYFFKLAEGEELRCKGGPINISLLIHLKIFSSNLDPKFETKNPATSEILAGPGCALFRPLMLLFPSQHELISYHWKVETFNPIRKVQLRRKTGKSLVDSQYLSEIVSEIRKDWKLSS